VVGEIVLVRHGQTGWSASGRHTSHTDLDLTPDGEWQARQIGQALAGRRFGAVSASPRRRARRTAELAGLVVTEVDGDLVEWDYGRYEGLTGPQIHQHHPEWSLWRDGCPGGESPEQVGQRLDRVLARARRQLAAGDVALVGHGHALRVAAARWIDLPVAAGGRLRLDTGTMSVLGYEHDLPVLLRWNADR
jgi:probable phosphoglycerate mutase